MKLVKIKWVDSHSVSQGVWHRLDDIGEEFFVPLNITTVGYIVRESKHAVTVASSKTVDGQYHGLFTIPRVAITKMKEL